jgi:predicted metalloprotease
MKKMSKPACIFLLALTCSLTLSACASPVAPAAKPANFYEAVRSDAEKFWTDYFSSELGRSYTPITRMQLFAGEVSACGGSQSGPFYCRPDRVVYLDTDFMQTHLSAFGDFASAMIIAHEVGHHTQNLLGLTGGFTIQRELQADCLAGGWVGSAGARGLLDVGDYQEAANSLFTLGDHVGVPWFDPQAHGTPQLRVEAFRTGFLQGVSSC